MGEKNKKPIDVNTETRARKYALNYKGEIVVFIRAKDDQLKSKHICKQIFDNFKYVSEVTQMNQFKIKIQFNESEKNNQKKISETVREEAEISMDDSDRIKAIKEANLLANSSMANCHIYIPAKYSEVQGVISWPIGQDIEDFVSKGRGKFNNSAISEVRVVETFRLKKKLSETSSELEETSIVIVTFEGNLLPNKLRMENLIIPVREYHRREMFCESCKRYGHTKKFCNNKKLERPTFLCMQCKINDHIGGSKNCPRRKILEKKHSMTLKKLRQRTYAEMLKELDPTATAHEKSADVTAPSMSFPTRKEETEAKRTKKQVITTNRSQSVNKPQKQATNKYPPGFKKQNDTQIPALDETSQAIVEGLKDFMNNLNVPPTIQQLILAYVLPHIDTFIQKITDTFSRKIMELFSK